MGGERSMTITTIGTTALLACCFVHLSLAEDRPDPRLVEPPAMATEKSAASYDRAVATPAKSADGTSVTTGNSEVFQSILIAAGKTYTINSTMDYSAAGTVAITLECIICSTAATSLGNSGLVLQASWTVPTAGAYVVAENKVA